MAESRLIGCQTQFIVWRHHKLIDFRYSFLDTVGLEYVKNIDPHRGGRLMLEMRFRSIVISDLENVLQ